jgi:hypothetical protein
MKPTRNNHCVTIPTQANIDLFNEDQKSSLQCSTLAGFHIIIKEITSKFTKIRISKFCFALNSFFPR